MNVLIFQHVPWETPGLIHSAIGAAGHAAEIMLPADRSRAETACESSAALVIMGGPMSANDDLDYLRQEMRLIERAMADEKPILGVCLGAQLLAKALGARVYRNPVKEIGWGAVRLTAEAQADPLFRDLPETIAALHWHGETFDLPAGARLLGSSDQCVNQAFRAGDNAWGLQFHIEITPEMIRNWVSEPEMCGDLAFATVPMDAGKAHNTVGSVVFERWVSRIGARSSAVVS